MELMLRVSSDIINQAKNKMLQRSHTPSRLASEIGIAVQLVENFLNGEIVDRHSYNSICQKLDILLENPSTTLSEIPTKKSIQPLINIQPPTNNDANKNNDVNNAYLADLKQQLVSTLIYQCDRLKLLDINSPLRLQDLYVDPNVFTDLPSGKYLELNETLANVLPEHYDRFYLNKLQPPSIPANQALEESKKILLVGRLGSGKTTLLKYWAIACITGKILPDYLPIFLPLRSLISLSNLHASHHPFQWLKKQLINYGLPDELLGRLINNNVLEQLLKEGRLLLLWDGLDEMPETHRREIAQQIFNFSDRYPQNRIVCTSRNPIYAHIFESFQTIEIAPFQEPQINSFASKWFVATCSQKPNKLVTFQQLLDKNQPLAEIATNPLLLTYLCTTFNSCEYLKPSFYQEILNLQLTKWEQTKCLPSDRELSVDCKLDLLSYVALISLDRHGYIWQNNELEDDFQACIKASHNLVGVQIDRDRLFQSLKWQHSLLIECAKGIHRLSHTTLHDYLAAYRIANSKPAIAQKYLLDRMHLKRWHGVILMTASISQQADLMLKMMKRKIDELLIADPHLQSFLTWVNQQSIQIKTPYKAATIRALYLDIDLENNRTLDRARAIDMAHSRALERAKMKSMGMDMMETDADIDYTVNLALNLDLALYFANNSILELASAIEPNLYKGLQLLRQKLPDPYKDRHKFANWWQVEGLDWTKKLRNLIVHHRKNSQEWEFSENQINLLRVYHDTNKLLLDCLNNAEYVSPLVKNQIESTLLLPITLQK